MSVAGTGASEPSAGIIVLPFTDAEAREAACNMLTDFGYAPFLCDVTGPDKIVDLITGSDAPSPHQTSHPAGHGFADRATVVVTVGGLAINGSRDAASVTADIVEHRFDGVEQFVRQVGFEAGHSVALMENPCAGLVGSTLVMNLPSDPDAVASVLEELREMLEDLPQSGPGGPGGGGPGVRQDTADIDPHFLQRPPGSMPLTPMPSPQETDDATVVPMPRPLRDVSRGTDDDWV